MGQFPHVFEHQPVVQLVPQLPAHIDRGQLEQDDQPGDDGVDNEERSGLEAGRHKPIEREYEEEATDGEHDVGHRGEVRVDGVEVRQEIDAVKVGDIELHRIYLFFFSKRISF